MVENNSSEGTQQLSSEERVAFLAGTIQIILGSEMGDAEKVLTVRALVSEFVDKTGREPLFVNMRVGGEDTEALIIDQNRQTGKQNWVLDRNCQLRYDEGLGKKAAFGNDGDWLRLAPNIPEAFGRRLWIYQRRQVPSA